MVKAYFGEPTILINLFLMTLIWLSQSINTFLLAQYGRYQNQSHFGYQTLCEILAILAAGFMFHFMGVRTSMAATFAASFLACGMLVTHNGSSEAIQTYINPMLSLITSATVTIIYLAHSQLFPVGCAAAALGLSSFLARVFESVVPFLELELQQIPLIVFAAIALGGVLATLGLQDGPSIGKQKEHVDISH